MVDTAVAKLKHNKCSNLCSPNPRLTSSMRFHGIWRSPTYVIGFNLQAVLWIYDSMRLEIHQANWLNECNNLFKLSSTIDWRECGAESRPSFMSLLQTPWAFQFGLQNENKEIWYNSNNFTHGMWTVRVNTPLVRCTLHITSQEVTISHMTLCFSTKWKSNLLTRTQGILPHF